MKIMFDVDGVLADFVIGYTTLAKKMGVMEDVIDTHEQKDWGSLNSHTVWEKINNVNNHFFECLPPLINEDTFKEINKLCNKYDVYFVTSRRADNAKLQTENWLRRQLIYNPTVITTKYKGDFAKAVGIDYSIEDKAENAWCISWLSKDTKSYLIDRPYNRTSFGTSKIRNIKTVEEYIKRILQ